MRIFLSQNIVCVAAIVTGCMTPQLTKGQKTQQIIVKNPSAIKLTDKPIAIERSNLHTIPAGRFYPLIISGKDTIPSQLDDLDGDNKWDQLFFVANLAANSSKTFSLKWISTKPDYVKRTSVRFGKRSSANTPVEPATNEVVYKKDMPKSLGFQRYQTDGPSWENDKVGFRHYLDGRNAKDVFGKLTSEMSPEKVGINAKGAVEDNYHVMEKWGRDILAVGNSIGIGGVAMVEGVNMYRLGVTVDDSINNIEKTTFNILTKGPVRSAMKFTYNDWKPGNGKSYNVEETTSIWPGMYAYHNSVKVTGMQGQEQLGIGMVNLNSTKQPTEIRIGDKWVVLINYDKHTYNKEWWLGLALILPANAYKGFIEAPRKGKVSNTFLAKLETGKSPVNYYAVAAWELSEPGFKDENYFKQYVEKLVRQLSVEVQITVK
jgi:hypothetical protein